MAKAPETTEKRPSLDTPPQTNPSPQQRHIEVDDTRTVASYANFCRITGTPEEVIVDFGLNPQPIGVPSQPVIVSQRIVMNYYTAKRMLHALRVTLERHEGAFGQLELDVQKRVVATSKAPGA